MTSGKRLFRRPSAGRLGGVCAGIAEYLDTDVTLIRLLWIVLSIVPGAIVGGIVAYVVAWIIVPELDEPVVQTPGARRLERSMRDRKIAGVCGGLADYFEIDPTVVRVGWAVLTVVPGGIVMGVVAYAVGWFIMPSEQIHSVAVAPSTVS